MNRTCTVVINHSISKEFKKASKGIPYVGHEELTFCARTLAAKWMLNHKNALRRASDFYVKFWDDKNEPDYVMNFYWGGSKNTFDETMDKVRTFAEDLNEQRADAEYVMPNVKK